MIDAVHQAAAETGISVALFWKLACSCNPRTILQKYFQLRGDHHDVSDLKARFKVKYRTAVDQARSGSWWLSCKAAAACKKALGRFPTKAENARVYVWLQDCRNRLSPHQLYAQRNPFSAVQREALAELGVQPRIQQDWDRDWWKQFDDLEAYYVSTGEYPSHVKGSPYDGLGSWTSKQRSLLEGKGKPTSRKLTEDKIEALWSINIFGNLHGFGVKWWYGRYAQVCAYVDQHGGLPRGQRENLSEEARPVFNWVYTQKLNLKPSTSRTKIDLTDKQKEDLRIIGILKTDRPWGTGWRTAKKARLAELTHH